jgi:hypothetical protein
MQQVPALAPPAVAAQLVEARARSRYRRRRRSPLEQLRAGDDFAQDGAAAHQLHAPLVLLRLAFAEQVHPLEDALLDALRHGRVRVVLVHHGDVVEDVLLLAYMRRRPSWMITASS